MIGIFTRMVAGASVVPRYRAADPRNDRTTKQEKARRSGAAIYPFLLSIIGACLVLMAGAASALVPDVDNDGVVGLPEAVSALQDSQHLESIPALRVVSGLDGQSGPTDIRQFLVVSDGSRSLGNPHQAFNDSRDTGSKIVYFDVATGDNDTAGVYWWNGTNIVDADGSTVNPDNNQVYGTDPLTPNEAAIKPFKEMLAYGDTRLQTQMGGGNVMRFAGLAAGYPDWFLFRRGQTHDTFDMRLVGGRSEAEPMVAAAYGPLGDGRAVMAPGDGYDPFAHNWGEEKSWLHMVLYSFEMRTRYGYYGTHTADTYAEGGGPVTAFIEDCYWPASSHGNHISYPPQKTTLRRCILANAYKLPGHGHVQGYYSSGFKATTTLDEVILYKNGFQANPVTDPDPLRTVFDRNVYQQGGAKMGHTYRNVLFADGGSGSPQMRVGGLIENSLIVEGYWHSNTFSGTGYYANDWLVAEGQVGQSAVVRNNVQLVLKYPTPADPDTHGVSQTTAHPRWGYQLLGGSFGAVVENNIISGAMLDNELQAGYGLFGMQVYFAPEHYVIDGQMFPQKNNVLRNNIIYKAIRGFYINGNIAGAEDIRVEDNVVMANTPIYGDIAPEVGTNQLLVAGNRFYSDDELPQASWIGEGNSVAPIASAQETEAWPDPERTLKRYVEEELGLSLLDWTDNPFLDPDEKQIRIDAGETYDPNGLKTFMAVATNMRMGGVDAIPTSGKPSMTGDYPWDKRFTAVAVVNWIRAGFNMAPVQ